MNNSLRAVALLVGLIGAIGAASAQDVSNDTGPGGALPGPNALPPDSQKTHDGVTSVQPVPGAMPGSDAVPSTLSEKNAADDKLTTLAYTFNGLTDDQRRAIYQSVEDKPTGPVFSAGIGTELPATIDLQWLPKDIATQIPQTKGYQYAFADHRVFLVAPANRIVVAVIQSPVTTGQR